MQIQESEIFIKQVYKIKKKFRSVEGDVNSLKEALPALAFKSIFPKNIHISTILIKESENKRNVWRIRILNSDNNKGNSGGYRVFYCEGKIDESVLLLGIYPKQEIKDNEYCRIAKELVEACC
jgi:mRNA-degrading endonuclease RelE of RelBE toxin-antitoxin system